MKKNRILTESQKKQILENKQKNIIENFTNVFNKIKRLNENEVGNELPEEDVKFLINLFKNNEDINLFEIFKNSKEIQIRCKSFTYEFETIDFETVDKNVTYNLTVETSFYTNTTGTHKPATYWDPPEGPEIDSLDFADTTIKIKKHTKNTDTTKIYINNNEELEDLILDILEDADEMVYVIENNYEYVNCDDPNDYDYDPSDYDDYRY